MRGMWRSEFWHKAFSWAKEGRYGRELARGTGEEVSVEHVCSRVVLASLFEVGHGEGSNCCKDSV